MVICSTIISTHVIQLKPKVVGGCFCGRRVHRFGGDLLVWPCVAHVIQNSCGHNSGTRALLIFPLLWKHRRRVILTHVVQLFILVPIAHGVTETINDTQCGALVCHWLLTLTRFINTVNVHLRFNMNDE